MLETDHERCRGLEEVKSNYANNNNNNGPPKETVRSRDQFFSLLTGNDVLRVRKLY